VGHDHRAADLLVGVPHVHPEADVRLDRLVELRRLKRLDRLDRFVRGVVARAVDLLPQALVPPAASHETSTPIDLAVPSMIFIAWSTSFAFRSGIFVSAIWRT
jgi:hypothetical protein